MCVCMSEIEREERRKTFGFGHCRWIRGLDHRGNPRSRTFVCLVDAFLLRETQVRSKVYS